MRSRLNESAPSKSDYQGGRIEGLAVEASQPRVAILSNTSASLENATRSAQKAEDMARSIRSMGIGVSVLSDAQASSGFLNNYILALAPYHADMPEVLAESLARHMDAGGKVILFYWVPDVLLEPLGLRALGYVHENETHVPNVFAEVRFTRGRLKGTPRSFRQHSWNLFAYKPVRGSETRVAAWWYSAGGRRSLYPAVLVSSRGAVMSHILLSANLPGQKRFLLSLLARYLDPDVLIEAVQANLDKARAFGAEEETARLEKILQRGMWRALDFSQVIEDRARQAYLRNSASRAGEIRGLWRQNPWLKSWNTAMKELKKYGFNAFFPKMSESETQYPSEVLSQSLKSAKKGDPLKAALKAAARHGIALHVWRINYLLRENAAWGENMAEQERIQIRANGSPYRTGGGYVLCPSHPLNKNLELRVMMEVVKNYEPAGIHLDYIRYPSSETCFCSTCRRLFEEREEKVFSEWPDEVLRDPESLRGWRQFRQEQITDLVRRVAEGIRETAPRVKVSAAVISDLTVAREKFGQDWKLWIDRGYLDFVCPMNYTHDPEVFRGWVTDQATQVGGRVPLIPGIGVFRIPRVEGVEQQITIARQQGADGYVLFDHSRSQGEVMKGLGLGVNRFLPGEGPSSPGLTEVRIGLPEDSSIFLGDKEIYESGQDLLLTVSLRKDLHTSGSRRSVEAKVFLVDAYDRPRQNLGLWNSKASSQASWCLRLPGGMSRILIRGHVEEQGSERAFLERSRPLWALTSRKIKFLEQASGWLDEPLRWQDI